MAYFGKEFSFEKQENFEAYAKALGSSAEEIKEYMDDRSTYKIVKDGDSYKLITGSDERTFKPGVPFTDSEGTKSTITVDGDTFTQVEDYGSHGTGTTKMEFSPNQLKMTLTTSEWNGVAYRYYKA